VGWDFVEFIKKKSKKDPIENRSIVSIKMTIFVKYEIIWKFSGGFDRWKLLS